MLYVEPCSVHLDDNKDELHSFFCNKWRLEVLVTDNNISQLIRGELLSHCAHLMSSIIRACKIALS